MSRNQLKINVQGARDLLLVFGGVRPWIGAIFGVVVAATIQGGLFPAIEPPSGADLPFYTVVGFLSGFSERFAQDMLSTTGKSLTQPDASEDGGAGETTKPGNET